MTIEPRQKGHAPAAWVEQQRVFLLRLGEAKKLMRGLDYYVKTEPMMGIGQD